MKKLCVEPFRNLRKLKDFVNDFNLMHRDDLITREDIVSIEKDASQYYLVYFK